MAIKPNYQKDADNVIAVQTSKDPIEQQILAAGNLSEAQVEAIRGFQRRKDCVDPVRGYLGRRERSC